MLSKNTYLLNHDVFLSHVEDCSLVSAAESSRIGMIIMVSREVSLMISD